LFTGWLLLGFLLYAAAAGLDGAFLAPNLRRARNTTGEGSQSVAAAATTVQFVAWLLLVIVVFLMVAKPF
jgi:membrane protein implicated in regulation of membrane protease activity